MKWSPSAARTFAACQRKWFYSNFFAYWGAKDKLRKEAYYLKQLQSIHAWRGSLVDKVISRKIVPAMNTGPMPSTEEVTDYAMQLAEIQLEFGKKSKHRQPGITKTNTKDEYCALFDVEYGDLAHDAVEQAKKEITISIQNLMGSAPFSYVTKENSHVIDQRSLPFVFDGITVSCTPDLVAFFENEPPMIIDWKVHAFATHESRMQLALYAAALSRTNPHKDFPENFITKENNVRLMEFQLLKNKPREYSLSEEDILDVEDYIFQSITNMRRACDWKEPKMFDPSDFQTARKPDECSRCGFKKLCWKDEPQKAPVQLGLLGVFL